MRAPRTQDKNRFDLRQARLSLAGHLCLSQANADIEVCVRGRVGREIFFEDLPLIDVFARPLPRPNLSAGALSFANGRGSNTSSPHADPHHGELVGSANVSEDPPPVPTKAVGQVDHDREQRRRLAYAARRYTLRSDDAQAWAILGSCECSCPLGSPPTTTWSRTWHESRQSIIPPLSRVRATTKWDASTPRRSLDASEVGRRPASAPVPGLAGLTSGTQTTLGCRTSSSGGLRSGDNLRTAICG